MTRRQDIVKILSEQEKTLRELAILFHTSAKDITIDLEHIAISIKPRLQMTPSTCKQCGFVFKNRQRVKRPTKCPKCNGEKITEPVFRIV